MKTRDYNIVMTIRREIDLRTKSETKRKPKFSRKEKHRSKYEQ
jgi:hypothetical protein